MFHSENNLVIRKLVQKMLEKDEQLFLIDNVEFSLFNSRLMVLDDIDVLLLGLSRFDMLNQSGSDGTNRFSDIAESFPGVKIVVHSVYNDAESIKNIMSHGADGFVSKLGKHWEISEAIHTVWRGEKFVCSQTKRAIKNPDDFFNGLSDKLQKNDKLFTNRECDVLQLLGIGLSSKEIANNLYISLKTVETHRKSLIRKSYVKNTAQLIAFSSLQGYL